MDLQSFLCNGRRILLPLDIMPTGHTYSLGFTQMHPPTSTRRRVGAYVLYVCPDTSTPLSQLGIHEDLVNFGGFTPATARLALVDGQPPSNFTRPGLPWIQTVPLHTPALGFGTFPLVSTAPSVISCSSPSTATTSVSATSTVVVSTPPDAQMLQMPHFGAIVVPPVVTFNPSPPPRSQDPETTYQVLSVPLSPAASTDVTSPVTTAPVVPPQALSDSSSAAPILQWPSSPASGPLPSMPVLDTSATPFSDLLCVPADTTAAPASPTRRRHRLSQSSVTRARGSVQPYPFYMPSPRRQPTATQVVAPRASPSSPPRAYSPVRAPTGSVYGGPLWSDYRPPSPSTTPAPVPIGSDSSSSEADDSR